MNTKQLASIFIISTLFTGLLFASAESKRYTEVPHETRSMSDSLRKADNPEGTYVTLSDGITHYTLTGPTEGEVVVLIHGASLAEWVWDPQIKELTKAGFRVLCYDQYSRGFSDYPHTTYDIQLYGRQLMQLLDILKITDPVHIVGHSFGGFITAFTTAQHPDRFKSVTLISPGITTPASVNFMVNTAIARWYVHGNLRKLPQTLAGILIESGIPLTPYKKLYEQQSQTKGYEYSLISLFENAVGNYLPYYAKLTNNNIPTQLIWGTHDKQAKEKYVEKLHEVVPALESHQLQTGHVPQFSSTEETNRLLLGFLERNMEIQKWAQSK